LPASNPEEIDVRRHRGDFLAHVPMEGLLSQSKPVVSPDNVVTSFKQLEAAADRLNTISDDLTAPINKLDLAFKDLNLGVPTWVEMEGDIDENGLYWSREVGYAKVRGKWGIALRTRDGDASDPDSESIEKWPFSEGPRTLRLKAIDFLPDLIDAMVNEAKQTSEKIKGKIGRAAEIAEAVLAAKEPTAPSKSRRK
jgi:hypothetical protein